jgi:Thioredoxin
MSTVRNGGGGDVFSSVVSTVAQIQEEQIGREMDSLDQMLSSKDDNGDDMIQQWRQKRLQEMQRKVKEQERYRSLPGHGVYEELGQQNQLSSNTMDIAKEFFHTIKQSERLVVHFYRPTTEICEVFHRHLSKLAVQHIETRFLKVNVSDCADNPQQQNSALSFLVERLQIQVMPTLLLIQDQKVLHRIEGCTELGNHVDFTTHHLAYVLGKYYSMLDLQPNEIPDASATSHQASNRNSCFISGRKGATRSRYAHEDDESGEDDNYESFE